MRRIGLMLALIVGCIVLWLWYRSRTAGELVEYRTAAVIRGDLTSTIGATGTLEPQEVIDVGAQVTAQIVSFGKDTDGKPIDYGSQVEEGMLLARLDDVVYAATVTEAQAQLAQSKAGVIKAKADLAAAQAKLYAAQRDWGRAERIGPSDALAQTAYDNYKSLFEQAKANVGVAEAAVTVAEAAVEQSDSAVKRAQRNLGFTVITSPVTGTVIDRRVNIGQTVTSNLNVASLFLIARDLKHMQVWVSVNEADIGQITPAQAVSFTVDAFPGETFRGTVRKIRPNAAMTQNVVTYTIEVDTDNANLRLRPYLTANVQFEVSQRKDVLLVPNAALRWAPADASSSVSPSSPTAATRGAKKSHEGRHGTVYVREESGVEPVEVVVGLTDGTNTQVTSERLSEGAEVVTGDVVKSAAGTSSKNPFVPQMPRRR